MFLCCHVEILKFSKLKYKLIHILKNNVSDNNNIGKKVSFLHFEDLMRDIGGNRYNLLHDESNEISMLKYLGFQ